ncbi:methyltransferase domain-containing protein, partial [Rhodoplanes tepidamans]
PRRRRPPAPGPALDMADPAFWDRSAASLRSFHRAMGADATVAMLEDLPEWPAVRRLLDLGAGSEVLATTIAARRPDVSVAVLDLPQPAARIAAAVAATPQRDRVDVIPGDFNTVDLGGGYDLIVASMTLYYAADLVAVLARARAALRPGGVLVSVHEGLTDARTAPEEHVVGRLVPVLRGRDLSFDAGAIADAMRDAGFARVARAVVATPFGTMEKTIGRSA